LTDTWKSSAELGLTGFHENEWTNFISSLNLAGVTLNEQSEDTLIWSGGDSSGVISAKNVYAAIVSTLTFQVSHGWCIQIWKWMLPLKVILFFLLVVHNRILTWDNLQAKGWFGSGLFPLCKLALETVSHLFIDCSFTLLVWINLQSFSNSILNWRGQSLIDCMDDWTTNKLLPNRIPVLLCCHI
jgi:hypothetical protein